MLHSLSATFVRNGLSTQYLKSAIANFAQMSSSGSHDKNIDQSALQLPLANPDIIPEKSQQGLSAEAILAGLPSCISSLDATGIWTNINCGNSDYFASIETQFFDKWVGNVVHVQDRVAVLKAVDDCRTGRHNVVVEFRLVDNTYLPTAPKWAEMTCSTIAGEKTILTTLVDVTHRKNLEAQVREAQELSEAANLEKSRFLANMSHELRTPLNAIIGFSEILKCGMVSADNIEKQNEYHTLINESGLHLLSVLNDILDMSKIEAGKYEIYPEKTELTQIISSSISMLMPLADKAGVKLRFANAEDTLSIEADSRALRQILINLISNAIKFSSSGSEVQISARRRGSKIEWQIQDQGQGISAKNLERLGEPFRQVDGRKNRKHEGTGLGLSIVKGLVNLHHGKLTIASELGIGTNVTVELPRSLAANSPVPYVDADTIIRIKPCQGDSAKLKPALSTLAG